MIRQSDSVRVTEKCYSETEYNLNQNNPAAIYILPYCVYLENGKCSLNCCIKNVAEVHKYEK